MIADNTKRQIALVGNTYKVRAGDVEKIGRLLRRYLRLDRHKANSVDFGHLFGDFHQQVGCNRQFEVQCLARRSPEAEAHWLAHVPLTRGLPFAQVWLPQRKVRRVLCVGACDG